MQRKEHDNQSKKHHAHSSSIILGTLAAGLAEISLCHIPDGVINRIQVYQGKVIHFTKPLASFANFGNAVFNRGAWHNCYYLYKGITVGIWDKIAKRINRFGGQEILVNHALQPALKKYLNPTLIHALGGVLVGISEIFFLPLDTIKVNIQLNPDAFKIKNKSKNFIKDSRIYQAGTMHGWKLWNGWQPTAWRNGFGSGILFGAYEFFYAKILKVTRDKASFTQRFVASSVSASLSVTLTLPWDVVKKRMQQASVDSNHPNHHFKSMQHAKKMWREEGMSCFFKGNFWKIGNSVAKLTTAMMILPKAINTFEKLLHGDSQAESVKPKHRR